MFVKNSFFTAVYAAALVSAHSWLECVKVTEVGGNAASWANVYNAMPITCDGHPRNKVNNGDWIAESTNYMWDLNQHGREAAPACNPAQTLNYPGNTQMATARPGDTLKMRHWGNGHSEWANNKPNPRDPGLVRVYWAGEKEHEIKMASELTDDWKIAEANFTADAIIVNDPTTPNGRNERANFFNVKLPDNMETGRHMMVWAWAYAKDDFNGGWKNTYTTCFDVNIIGGSGRAPSRKPTENSIAGVEPANIAAKAKPTGISPKCQQTCLQAGNKAWPCDGPNCAPCRYAQGNGEIHCYQKSLQTGSCPFTNGYDCSSGKSF